MRCSRAQQQRQRVLLCLLPLFPLRTTAAAMTMAVRQTAEGIRHDLWWWLALGLSGFFIVLLMFLLLFSWTCSLAASDSVTASPRYNGRHQLQKQNDVGPFDGETSFSPATTATRHGSNDMDDAHCGAGGAAVCFLPHANSAEGRSDVEARMTVFDDGARSPSQEVERPAPRQVTTAGATVLVPGYTPKRVASASSKRSAEHLCRSAAAAVPQQGVPSTAPSYFISSTSPVAVGIPKQLQPSALGRHHNSPGGLNDAALEADVVVAVNSLEKLLAAAERRHAEPSVTARLAGSVALQSTLESVPGGLRAAGDTPRDIPAVECTASGAPAMACEGSTTRQPTSAVLPQGASSKLQQSSLPNAVRQYYFGVERVWETSASAASPVLMPQRASHEAVHAPPKHRSSMVGRCPVEAQSKPAPYLSHETLFTDARTTATAAEAPAPSTTHGGAAFNPLTQTSETVRTAAGHESGGPALVTNLCSLPKKLHVAGADGAAAMDAQPHTSPACRGSQRVSALSRSKLRLELFREGGSADGRRSVSSAQLAKRAIAQQNSTEDRPARQRLRPHAAPAAALTRSRPRRHRRDRQSLSQPPAYSRDGASTSSVLQRTASASGPAATRSASTTVTKGAPQSFFAKRGTSPVRPAGAAAPAHPTTAASANSARDGRGGAAAQRLPTPTTLPGDHRTQTPAPAVVASSLFSSVSPRQRAAATAGAASILQPLTTRATTDANGGASIKSPRLAATSCGGTRSFSLRGRSPLRNSPGRMRSSNMVTFVGNDDACVIGGSRDGPTPALFEQLRQPLKSRERSAKPSSLSYASPSAGDCAGVARLERLSDPLLPTAAALPFAAPAPASVDVTVAQGHRSLGPLGATASVEPRQAKSPAADERSAAATATPTHSMTTATPLEVPTDVAACRIPAALAPTASFITHQEGYGATAPAAAALMQAAAEESGDLVSYESSDSDDGDSLNSEASTVAAGMLPGVPRDQRGLATTMPPTPTAASHQQQPRSAVSASSATCQRLSHSFGIQVLRISHPNGVAQESPVPSSALAQRSPHHDAMNTISRYPSKALVQYLLDPHGNAALPTRPPSRDHA
ncbi:hypothetical protein LSCM4_07786 [Leishmania orientalis]|uniref:Proteophosphoglycan ppg4 n=1 Tax=Leishmania orientalis TaxID=2249476 RepID=A0A836KUB9_9TRYP|nr:hypothetical protein LSCM4_07786 [Leishmania orientalis]